MKPYKQVDDFYNYNKIMSLNRQINFLVKERGFGGTLGWKGIAYNAWKKANYDDNLFIIIRLSDTECEAMSANKGAEFFTDYSCVGIDVYKDGDPTIEGEELKVIKIHGKTAGYIFPLNLYDKYKGTCFHRAKHTLIDEFIPAPHRRLTYDLIDAFVHTVENIYRTYEKVRMMCIGNTHKISTPLLYAFGFTEQIQANNGKFGFYFNRHKEKDLDKQYVLDYCESSEKYKLRHRKSTSGKVARILKRDKVVLENTFEGSSNRYRDLTKNLPKDARIEYIFHTQTDSFRLYNCPNNGYYLVREDLSKSAYKYMRYTFDKKLVSSIVTFAKKEIKELLMYLLQTNSLVFDNEYVESLFYSII